MVKSDSTKPNIPCPASVLELVDRFGQHIEAYKRTTYNETQVRREFIDPLFVALGWNVDNTEGYAEQYKEVVHEDAIKIGGSTKAPDYCFRIGGVRKYFVEAKKPLVDVKGDVDPAYQVRRYAWSSKLPLSILTDFEEFAVYDCRIKPNPNDKSSTARILYVTYDEYSERWGEIASKFSKDAILKGSFDKYAESTKRKRGTAEVDAEFLKEIESWREQLARNIALRNPDLSVRELNYAVSKTIDRIIFLRMCEDRGVETYAQLRILPNGPNIYPRLVELFRRADERYNSGLFHFEDEKGRAEAPDELTPKLVIDDKVLSDVIKRLYYPQCPYEFSVLPAEILGQVYEQFLGKVIRLTKGHRAVVEEKPEVKKAGGVYYTPSYIVDYIVEHTVGELLKGKTPADVGPMLPQKQSRARKEAVPASSGKQAKAIRILDPACGSGSFLLGAYQYLLDWHLRWYVENDPEGWAKKKNPPIYQAAAPVPNRARKEAASWRLAVAERKRILLNNIFGVDIDQQAVEVTKLSLLLRVLEGESQQTLENQLRFFHERALPDLAANIKCGNSLIGPDFYEGKQLNLLDDEERYRINVFDWQAEFPQVFDPNRARNPNRARKEAAQPNRARKEAAQSTHLADQPLPHGRGSECAAGFDAVIGNPPYGALFSGLEKAYLNARFRFQSYQLDSYLLFLEQSLRLLLRTHGRYGMIIPNPWLTNLLQTKMRQLVVDTARVVEIVHFRFPVFPRVTVDTEIVLLENARPNGWRATVQIVDSIETSGLSRAFEARTLTHDQDAWRSLTGGIINVFLSDREKALAAKCESASETLGSLCSTNVGIKPYQKGKGRPPQSRGDVEGRVFDSETKLNDTYRAYLRGADINRYSIAPLEPRFLRFGPWLAEPRPAADFDAPVKLFMRQTGDRPVCARDTEQYLCLNNMHVIVPKAGSPASEYLLGIINSKLISWYYWTLNPEFGEALAEVKKANVAKLPVRSIDGDNVVQIRGYDRICGLVSRMLTLHSQLTASKTPTDKTAIQRQIDATDKQIDQLVYELYGLTDDEIRIVEEATRR